MLNHIFSSVAPVLLLTSLLAAAPVSAQTKSVKSEPTVIELVQTPGEFVVKAMTVKPGKYRFKVVNQQVGHDVGFVLSERAADGKTGKELLKFAPIKNNESKLLDAVDFKEGVYDYVCPLNPTPHYTLTVSK